MYCVEECFGTERDTVLEIRKVRSKWHLFTSDFLDFKLSLGLLCNIFRDTSYP